VALRIGAPYRGSRRHRNIYRNLIQADDEQKIAPSWQSGRSERWGKGGTRDGRPIHCGQLRRSRTSPFLSLPATLIARYRSFLLPFLHSNFSLPFSSVLCFFLIWSSIIGQHWHYISCKIAIIISKKCNNHFYIYYNIRTSYISMFYICFIYIYIYIYMYTYIYIDI